MARKEDEAWWRAQQKTDSEVEEAEDRRAREAAGFDIVEPWERRRIHLRDDEHIVCERCSALVWDWRKHRSVCHG